MANQHSQYVCDEELVLHALGAEAASGTFTILDLGQAYCGSAAVVDVEAMESDTGDESYILKVTGSSTDDFSADVHVLAIKELGLAIAPTSDNQYAAGRYVIPFTNEENGDVFKYVRLELTVAGTITTGINFSAFVAKKLNT